MSWIQPTFIGMVWLLWSYRRPPPPQDLSFSFLLTLYVTNLQLIQNLKFCQTRASSVQGDFFSTIIWLTANSLKDACWMIAAFSADLVQVHMTNCTLISSLSGGRKHSSEYIPYNTQSLSVPGYIYLYRSPCELQTLSPLGIITFDTPAVHYLVNKEQLPLSKHIQTKIHTV